MDTKTNQANIYISHLTSLYILLRIVDQHVGIVSLFYYALIAMANVVSKVASEDLVVVGSKMGFNQKNMLRSYACVRENE